VQDVNNNIKVDPLSPMNDQSRLQASSVYGYPSLSTYAMNPAQPIRITVANGNLTHNGLVDSQADKNVAGIRADGVPRIFKVTNDLQVASSTDEK
jgi:hyperosmotically inducible periplasmic protein